MRYTIVSISAVLAAVVCAASTSSAVDTQSAAAVPSTVTETTLSGTRRSDPCELRLVGGGVMSRSEVSHLAPSSLESLDAALAESLLDPPSASLYALDCPDAWGNVLPWVPDGYGSDPVGTGIRRDGCELRLVGGGVMSRSEVSHLAPSSLESLDAALAESLLDPPSASLYALDCPDAWGNVLPWVPDGPDIESDALEAAIVCHLYPEEESCESSDATSS